MLRLWILTAFIGYTLAITIPCRNCPTTGSDGPPTGTCKSVTIEPCTAQPCILKKGTNITFSVQFVAGQAATALQAVVYGIIAGVPIKFDLPNPDGCKDSGINCPVVAGQTYTYTDDLFISSLYPSINLVVKWSLLDQSSNTVFCVVVPAKISS